MSPKRIAKALAGFGVVAIAALIITTVYVVRHRAPAPVLSKVEGLVPGALLHAHHFHWTQMKNEEQQWVLTAQDANYAGDRTSILLKNPVVVMTSQDGKRVMVVAPRALLKMDGNHVKAATLTGGTIINYGEFVVNTEQATFKPDSDQVDAPGFVTITGQGLKITGVGLTGHPKVHQFELESRVTTEITPRPKSEGPKKD